MWSPWSSLSRERVAVKATFVTVVLIAAAASVFMDNKVELSTNESNLSLAERFVNEASMPEQKDQAQLRRLQEENKRKDRKRATNDGQSSMQTNAAAAEDCTSQFCQKQLSDACSIEYKVNNVMPPSITMVLVCEGSRWVGIGFSESGTMMNSDAVLGSPTGSKPFGRMKLITASLDDERAYGCVIIIANCASLCIYILMQMNRLQISNAFHRAEGHILLVIGSQLYLPLPSPLPFGFFHSLGPSFHNNLERILLDTLDAGRLGGATTLATFEDRRLGGARLGVEAGRLRDGTTLALLGGHIVGRLNACGGAAGCARSGTLLGVLFFGILTNEGIILCEGTSSSNWGGYLVGF